MVRGKEASFYYFRFKKKFHRFSELEKSETKAFKEKYKNHCKKCKKMNSPLTPSLSQAVNEPPEHESYVH